MLTIEKIIFLNSTPSFLFQAWRSARLIGETCAEEALVWLSNRKQEEIEANNSCDLTIYSHIVRGFLLATQSNHPPRTLDLCVQLAVKFSTAKV